MANIFQQHLLYAVTSTDPLSDEQEAFIKEKKYLLFNIILSRIDVRNSLVDINNRGEILSREKLRVFDKISANFYMHPTSLNISIPR